MLRAPTARRALLPLALLLAGTAPAPTQEEPPSPAEPAGIAARHPGDRDIAADPAVLFADDFESGTLAAWDEDQTGGDRTRCAVTTDPKEAFFGAHAVRMTAHRGKDNGAGLIAWLDEGQDELFARFYVRFAADAGYVHHFVHVNGSPERWGSFGKAGLRPDGTDFFTTGLEPDADWGRNPPPGKWMFYTYWPDMKASPDGRFWGNGFHGDAGAIPRDRWLCLEMRVRLNTPGAADGEQTMWLDGERIGHFTGFRWRTTPRLQANVFWLMSYVTERAFTFTADHAADHELAASTTTHTVWFDQVVVARTYIGPLVTPEGP